MPLQSKASRLEALRRPPRFKAVVLVERHPRNESEACQGVNDPVYDGLGHREHDATPGLNERAARVRRADLRVVVEVLEDREHGDRIEWAHVAQIVRETSTDETNAVPGGFVREIRIDADAAGDPTSQLPEQRAVRAADVEHASASRDVGRRLGDAPALQDAIEELQVACFAS